jgi:hypothetical protein
MHFFVSNADYLRQRLVVLYKPKWKEDNSSSKA